MHPHPALITAVEVELLFGLYSYEIPFASADGDEPSGNRLTLLYGNNGSGKTTVLRLLWHTLSPSGSSGHRSSIASIPFRSFTVRLATGDTIRIVKTDSLYGDFVAQVWSGGRKKLEQPYPTSRTGNTFRVRAGSGPFHPTDQAQLNILDPLFEEPFIPREAGRRRRRAVPPHTLTGEADLFVAYLEKLNAAPYMLADDRKIYGDQITGPHDRGWPQDDPALMAPESPGGESGGVAAELVTAIDRVNAMFQSQALAGSYKGSRSSNNAYLEILRRTALTDLAKADETTRAALMGSVEELASRTREYSRYGMLPQFDAQMFVQAIEAVPVTKISVVEDVLTPFIETQKARLEALAPTLELVRTFTGEMNQFFHSSGKEVVYDRAHGIRVRSVQQVPGLRDPRLRPSRRDAALFPEQLSSGERQILLLMLNTVLARENTRVFLIDEPELSLNAKWQRQLMDALLACTAGSSVQFVVATHSVEVITGHRASLSRMVPKPHQEHGTTTTAGRDDR
ncbi:AAA family ATPase [Kitasatospora sp. NPDC058046]|uniref:AAA family ATPase n=1 Tax=Kitasatospora sp. NPDC058046 TaxID=3346312 RepID=UPI0036DB1FDB